MIHEEKINIKNSIDYNTTLTDFKTYNTVESKKEIIILANKK